MMRRQPPPSRLRMMLEKDGICEGSYDVPPFRPYNPFITVEYNTISSDPELDGYQNINFVNPTGQMFSCSGTVSTE